MTTVIELYNYLNEAIPERLSLDWDNDGLMCCPDPGRRADRVLCALDVSADAVDYAAENNFDVIVSHHPLIFKPVGAIVSQKLIKIIRCGIAVMSFHTRLDIMEGGLNDRFAAMLKIRNTEYIGGGAGRIGILERTVGFDDFCINLKNTLQCGRLNAVKASDNVYKTAIVCGSGGDLIEEALRLGADTFISGECGYHRMLDAYEAGMNVFEAGHFFTERHAAGYLKDIIVRRCGGIFAEIYEKNNILQIQGNN
jgi:dinuclear metal center YbgI/SA1388 family protein